jgi:xylono-1,5-lactonase
MIATTPRLLGDPVCVWPAAAELGEGTCWSVREQALYWVDILSQRLFRFTPASGERREWRLPDTVSAVAERRSAHGLVVTLRRGLARFDPADGTVQMLDEPEPDRPGNRFNDGKCDAAGHFWGGTMDFDCKAPTGALWRFDADGRGTLAFDAGFAVTNGPTWSADGRTMFFNETVERRIHAFDFDPETGTLSRQREWLRFGRDDGFPDGMTTDAAGRLWIAHWGASCVTCHDADSGAELARVKLPASQVTNVAFGGAALQTLYISSARTGLGTARLADEPLAGGLFAVEVDSPGVPAKLFAG